MKLLRHPVFLICCAVFVIHQVMQKVLDATYAFADSYLDSLLAMPVILTLLVVERQYLFRKGENYRLSILEIIIATLFIAFVAEILFPLFSNRFTGDWMDWIFYGLGSMLFYLTINRKKN